MSELKKVHILLCFQPPSWSDPSLLLNKTPISLCLTLAILMKLLPSKLVSAPLLYPNFTLRSILPFLRPLEGILPSFLLPIFSIRWIETIILQCLLKLILQNLKVKVPIHPTINLDSIANTLPSHATPHHQGTTSKLQSSLYQPIIEHLTCLFPSPLVSI